MKLISNSEYESAVVITERFTALTNEIIAIKKEGRGNPDIERLLRIIIGNES